jgi:predicted lactoylglutathione lyase
MFREIVPFERIVSTDEFGDDFDSQGLDLPSGIVATTLFEDLPGGRTRLTQRIAHPSVEERRKHEAMGVVAGWHSTFDCLGAHLRGSRESCAAAVDADVVPPPARKLFVNLPVHDLKRSVDFFTKLGLTFDPRFTDESATCMLIGHDAYAMLLVRDRFRDFTGRDLCDTRRHTEGIFALSCASRAEVDRMAESALEAGGAHAVAAQDHGFMYERSFYDPDGHHWTVFWMDPESIDA